MWGQYEIIIIYNEDFGEVIGFESDNIVNDSNDIVTEAIRLELMPDNCRSRVKIARSVSEYEYGYIDKRRSQNEKKL